MKPYSLENQLRIRLVILLGIIFFMSAFIADHLISGWLEHEFDEALEVKSQLLITLVKDLPEGVDFDFADEFMPEFSRDDDIEYFQIWTQDGSVFEKSISLGEKDLPYVATNITASQFLNIDLQNGEAGRMVQVIFIPQIPEKDQRTTERLAAQKQMTLAVAASRKELDLTIFQVHSIILVSLIAAVVILNFVVVTTVRKSFNSLFMLKKEVEALDAKNLRDRLSVDSSPSELNEVIDKFNDLLSRLEKSFSREQRFSTDVAHELKTPIAEIRSMSEVAMKWPDDTKLTAGLYSDILGSSKQMQNIVDSLLTLARYENNQANLSFEAIALNDAVSDALSRYKITIETNALDIFISIPDNTVIETSIVEFEIILTNLLSNAFSYCKINSRVSVLAKCMPDKKICFSIQNVADDLSQDDLEVMFDRLWRKSQSRTSSEHAGLGLSIVSAYSKVLGVNLQVDLTVEHVFTVSMTLPKSIS